MRVSACVCVCVNKYVLFALHLHLGRVCVFVCVFMIHLFKFEALSCLFVCFFILFCLHILYFLFDFFSHDLLMLFFLLFLLLFFFSFSFVSLCVRVRVCACTCACVCVYACVCSCTDKVTRHKVNIAPANISCSLI